MLSMPKMRALRIRGIAQEFMKLEMRMPQKMKLCYLGMVFGRSKFLAMAVTISERMTLVMVETKEAAICRPFVMRTWVEMFEQALPTLSLVYISCRLALQ